jgi:hypothetical protein
VHCLDAESMISSTILAFSSALILGAWSGPPSSTLINGLTLRYPFNHDFASDVKERDHHCLHFQLVYSCFIYSRGSGCLPLHRFPVCFWTVLKNLSFITYDDIFQHMWLFCHSFHDVRANVFPVVFLLMSEVFSTFLHRSS